MAADDKLSLAEAGDAASSDALQTHAKNLRITRIAKVLGSLIVILGLSDALDLYRKVGLVFINAQLLLLALATVFILRSFNRHTERTSVP